MKAIAAESTSNGVCVKSKEISVLNLDSHQNTSLRSTDAFNSCRIGCESVVKEHHRFFRLNLPTKKILQILFRFLCPFVSSL